MLPELKTPIPGSRSRELAQELRRYESRNVTYLSERFPIFWERAHGVNVWDLDGNRFLDFTSGFGVASLGYTPESVTEVLRDQAGKLTHAMGDVHPAAEKLQLCRKLSELTFENWGAGIGKTILTNSGAEAIEAALKTSWIATGKPGVISFEGSYHGLTCGALSVTGHPMFRKPFEKTLAGFSHFIPYPRPSDDLLVGTDLRAVRSSNRSLRPELITMIIESLVDQNSIGSILVEPIQGRGGEIIPPDGFLKQLRTIADRWGLLLIFDEIYTGWHRTGKRFACDHEGVVPDLVCVGKALTGGFPMGACVGKASVMDAWPESKGEALHTSTFLGNPIGCRMALESLRCLESDPVVQEVTEKGARLLEGLKKWAEKDSRFRNPRGRGLLAGIEVCAPDGKPDPALCGKIVVESLARGLIILGGGTEQNVLSFTPPFGISEEEIQFALKTVEEVALR